MDDRELLELAAGAACVSGGWGEHIEYHNGAVDLRDIWILEGDEFVPWNPLDDDGDALRLAVKLRIGLHWCKSRRIYAHTETVEECESSREHSAENTRRAIVRAAAEIGRAM